MAASQKILAENRLKAGTWGWKTQYARLADWHCVVRSDISHGSFHSADAADIGVSELCRNFVSKFLLEPGIVGIQRSRLCRLHAPAQGAWCTQLALAEVSGS